ncbi:MAG TPA: TRAP transporter small permease [Hyphomicrobiales bacterium]|nr:TRAP transporter small permease [Hyphomicrobiales bacterium]
MLGRLFFLILDRLEEILIGTLIAVATILIFIAVLQRYGLSTSITLANWGRAHGHDWLFQAGRSVFAYLRGFNLTWAQELCIYLFIWMAKFGAAYGVRQGIHVGVDVLVNRIGDEARKPVIVFALLCGAIFTFTIGTFGSVFVYNMAFTDQISPDLELPMWLVYLAIPAGSYLMCFRFLQVAWTFARTGEIPGHAHHPQVSVPGIGVAPEPEVPGLAVLPEGGRQ